LALLVSTFQVSVTPADNSVIVEELSVTCPDCGKRFASALQMDEETFSRFRIIEHTECCRRCGRANRFRKQDYYFFEVREVEVREVE
jgi:C4-type Zn-finger protein